MVEEALKPRGCHRGPDGQRLLSHMRSYLSWFLRWIPVALCPPAVAVLFAADGLAAALAGSTRAAFFLTTMMAVVGLWHQSASEDTRCCLSPHHRPEYDLVHQIHNPWTIRCCHRHSGA